MDMENRDMKKPLEQLHGNAAYTCGMERQYEHAEWTRSMYKQHNDTDIRMVKQQGHVACECSIYMQHGRTAWTRSMESSIDTAWT